MPHPLPADVAVVVGMRYFLVALPDDSAFLQAALAIYSELENSYKWGLEGEIIPDSEIAAQKWAASVAETVRLIQMSWPDLVIDHIDEIESMLGALRRITGCCFDEDVSDGDLYTDEIEEGVGNVPQEIIDAGYATGASDWAGFATYKCMIAHVVVDDLAGKLRKLAPLVDDAGIVVGGIGAIAAIISTILTGGGFAIAIGILGGVGAVASLYAKLSDGGILEDLANDVDTHHDELACAFIEGDGANSSVSAMYTKIDELFSLPAAAILKNLNSRPVAKALYAGRYDQKDIAATLAANGYVSSSYNCNCVEPALFTYNFDADKEGWNTTGAWYAGGFIAMYGSTGGGTYTFGENGTEINTRFEAVTVNNPTISKVKARVRFARSAGGTGDPPVFTAKLRAKENNNVTVFESAAISSNTIGFDNWYEWTFDIGQSIALDPSIDCLSILLIRDASANNYGLDLDWISGIP